MGKVETFIVIFQTLKVDKLEICFSNYLFSKFEIKSFLVFATRYANSTWNYNKNNWFTMNND